MVPVAYDEFGRETKKYLPYASTTGDGSYKADGLTQVIAYYSSAHPGQAAPFSTPFSETRFEASPLNRVEEQGAPGTAWQLSAGHTLKLSYGANNSNTAYATDGFAVRLYSAVPVATAGHEYERTLFGTGYYQDNQLYLTISKDENWVTADGKAGTAEEYKDKQGRILLKRVFNKREDHIVETLSTYYVYDDFGNLSFVLPPGADPDAAAVPTQSTLDHFCYQYRYDERSRLIEKRIPGKSGWDEVIYNPLDQVVFTQDPMQRAASQRSFVKYDALGRVVMTGIEIGHIDDRANVQGTVNTLTPMWETRDNTLTNYHGYNNLSCPSFVPNVQPEVVNYYDDYNIPGLPNNQSASYSSMTKGLLTATKVKVLGTTDQFLWTVNYYNDKGELVKVWQQHYLSGAVSVSNYDEISNAYSFTGELMASTRKHYVNGTESLYVYNEYTYDHMGRKMDSKQKTGDNATTANPLIVLARNNYNEIGQPCSKGLHSTDGGSSFAQMVKYKYNSRGWVTSQSAALFAMELKYEQDSTGLVPQYNGNISSQKWGLNTGLNKQFVYSYDKLNRLNSGLSSDNNNERIGYDVMGNITRMQRYAGGTLVDQMHYDYTDGNRLNSVLDTNINTNAAFQLPGTTGYSYDLNGNMLSRTNAVTTNNLSNITYNHLNLPSGITADGATITYTYDATGNKLKKLVSGSTSLNNDYISGIHYQGGVLNDVVTEAGRVVRLSATNYSYEYTLADHLGNGRVYFDINAGAARKIQETDYYAFGLDIQRSLAGTENKFQYNGKEKQDQERMYDYGARFYDPVIARWNVIDPMGEKYVSISPYIYVANNPVRLIDPDGMEIVGDVKEVEKLKKEAQGRIASETRRQERIQGRIDKRSASGKSTARLESRLATSQSMSSEMNSMLGEISIMEKSAQVYNVSTNYTGTTSDGETLYNTKTGAVDVKVSSDYLGNGGLAHELTHAYQFESGDVDFGKSTGAPGALYDITDEVSAYQRQFALTGNRSPVTESLVRGFKNQGGSLLYNLLPGVNLNKNSSLMMISSYNRSIPLPLSTVLKNPSSRYIDVSSTYFSNYHVL